MEKTRALGNARQASHKWWDNQQTNAWQLLLVLTEADSPSNDDDKYSNAYLHAPCLSKTLGDINEEQTEKNKCIFSLLPLHGEVGLVEYIPCKISTQEKFRSNWKRECYITLKVKRCIEALRFCGIEAMYVTEWVLDLEILCLNKSSSKVPQDSVVCMVLIILSSTITPSVSIWFTLECRRLSCREGSAIQGPLTGNTKEWTWDLLHVNSVLCRLALPPC